MRRRIACVLALCCVWPAIAAAQRVERYVETMDLAADGSAVVSIELDWPVAAARRVLLPATGEPTDVRVSATGPATAAVVVEGERPHIAVNLDPDRAGDEALRVTFRIDQVFDPDRPPGPHGNRQIRLRFLNTLGMPIDSFQGILVLPPDTVPSSVDDVVPDASESAVQVPYALGDSDGRRTVTMQAAPLAWGEEVAATVRFKAAGVPAWVLLALGAVAVIYLYRFSDLVRPAKAPPA